MNFYDTILKIVLVVRSMKIYETNVTTITTYFLKFNKL